MKSYQAYAAGGFQVTEATPLKAAQKFFTLFPTRRKCNIIEGKTDGYFFVVTYGLNSEGERPTSYKDVTKKNMERLQ